MYCIFYLNKILCQCYVYFLTATTFTVVSVTFNSTSFFLCIFSSPLLSSYLTHFPTTLFSPFFQFPSMAVDEKWIAQIWIREGEYTADMRDALRLTQLKLHKESLELIQKKTGQKKWRISREGDRGAHRKRKTKNDEKIKWTWRWTFTSVALVRNNCCINMFDACYTLNHRRRKRKR